jgi:hypothetical protein
MTTRVLVLQHPQEPGVEVGTVPVLQAALPDVIVRVGLSWPNLRAALGDDAAPDPKRWIVPYLGSGPHGPVPAGAGTVVPVDRKGVPLATATLGDTDGVVVLDGTWSQAKTLWWRNAWLLKLRRVVLRPARPSLYGRTRREPRREAISTLESVGLVLTALGEPPEVEQRLLDAFRAMLAARGGRRT